MNRLTRVGVGVAAISLGYAAVTAVAAVEPDSVTAPPGARVSIPERSAVDRAAVESALGRGVEVAALKTRSLPPHLQVPEGADSMDEGLWHMGSEKWGSVRVYRYSKPVDVKVRNWRSARAFVGHAKPHFAMDRYGVEGLTEVSVYIDVDGNVVAVQPTDYAALTEASFERNPSGAEEVGD